MVRTAEQHVRLLECRSLATAMRADCSKGGARAYFSVRELPTTSDCLGHLAFRRVRWPKLGLQVLQCHESVKQFVPGLPIWFQEQRGDC